MTAKTQAPGKTETKLLNVDRSGILQRKCDCGKSASLTGQCSECNAKNLLQRRSTDSTEVSEVPPIVHEVLRSPGQAIDHETRSSMESRFGHDFSQVRVHTDAKAAESTQAVSAVAYTLQNHVVFGQGQYKPTTHAGRHLLAHELTHVLQQQKMGSQPQTKLTVGSSGDTAEREADHIAQLVVSGGRVPDSFTTPSSSIQRACGEPALGTPACLDSPFDGVFVAGFPLFKFNVNCDDFAPGQGGALLSAVGALPATATIEIHGYASPDGPLSLNQKLACARALRAQSLLTTSAPVGGGIASSRIVRVVNHGPTPGPSGDRRSVVIQTTTPSSLTTQRFRAAAVSFLSCAECNPFTDDGTLGVTPPTTEPPMAGAGYRQNHFIEAELATTDGRHIAPGTSRLAGSGQDVGISHFCGVGGRAQIVSSATPSSPTLVTSTTGVEGIQFESELHSRVGAVVPPTLIGSPCGFLGTSPLIPIIGNTFRMRLFADGTKESEFVAATLYPSHFLYEGGTLKMFGGAPVHPRQDFFAWATSTGAPLSVSIIGFKALRFACCSPTLSRIACGTTCIGGFSAPTGGGSLVRTALHAAQLAAQPCPIPCAPAGSGCSGGPLVSPSNP